MELNKLPTWNMATVNEHLQWTIKKLCPTLVDFKLYYENDKFVDIDFYFGTPDDPCGLEEFTVKSKTYEQLIDVSRVLCVCLGLNFEED